MVTGARREKRELMHGLDQLDATMIVVRILIGSGIFIVSAESSRLVLAVWALAGLMTITGSQCCAELAAMLPWAGGSMSFCARPTARPWASSSAGRSFWSSRPERSPRRAVAFAGVLIGWVSASNYIVEPIVLGRYAISLSTQQLVAFLAIVVLTTVNTRGLEAGKLIQNTLTFIKTAALVTLIVLGLWLGWNRKSAALASSWWDSWANGWTPHLGSVWTRGVGAPCRCSWV
jgi:basic amino acid/polyamine antiporter, APA family